MALRAWPTDRGLWQGSTALVTGASGFVGYWLTNHLIEAGARVVGLSRQPAPPDGTAGVVWIKAVPGDMDEFETILAKNGPDVVFHLAGQSQVGTAETDPVGTFEANVREVWLLLDACRRARTTPRVVLASTERVYGTPKSADHALPAELHGHPDAVKEDLPVRGRHPYDVSKACAELIALSYAETYDLPVCCVRTGNLFGGGDRNFDRLIPGTIRQALAGLPPVLRSDGRARRDFLYIRDAVAGFVRIAEEMHRPEVRGQIFNLASGKPIEVIDMVRSCLEAAGRAELQPRIDPSVRDRTQNRQLCIEKALHLLGWTPQFDLRIALAETAQWYATHLEATDVRR